MSAPNCPVHNQPMRVSKLPSGGWYCTQRQEDGSYCDQRIKAPKPSSIQGVQPATALLPKADSHDVLAAAALNFAASMFRGAGAEMADDALQVAIKAYSAMKAIL